MEKIISGIEIWALKGCIWGLLWRNPQGFFLFYWKLLGSAISVLTIFTWVGWLKIYNVKWYQTYLQDDDYCRVDDDQGRSRSLWQWQGSGQDCGADLALSHTSHHHPVAHPCWAYFSWKIKYFSDLITDFFLTHRDAHLVPSLSIKQPSLMVATVPVDAAVDSSAEYTEADPDSHTVPNLI